APGRMFVIWYERAIPAREIRFGGRPAMSCPSKTMRPAVGRRTPVRQLKNVDLPAPLGPMIARISPGTALKFTPLSAVRPPNRTVRPSVRRIEADAPGGIAGGAGPGRSDVTLRRELAVGREDGLLLRHRLDEMVLAALDVEDELLQERLVVFLAQDLVALREVR